MVGQQVRPGGQGLDQHAGRILLIGLGRPRRRGQGGQPGAGPAPGAGGQPCRSRHVGAARHQQMAAAEFMPARLGHRQRVEPQGRSIVEAVGIFRQADADLADFEPSAQIAARHQQMAGLGGGEGNRHLGRRGGAQHRAAIAIDATRQIHRDHRQGALPDALHHGAGGALERPGQTGAEQGVDHQGVARQQIFGNGMDRPVPTPRGQGGIAFQRAAPP